MIATHIIQALRDRFGLGRALFVAHRREILDQTVRTLQQQLPGLRVEVEQGERLAAGDADITVASVQSLLRRKERYDPKAFHNRVLLTGSVPLELLERQVDALIAEAGAG